MRTITVTRQNLLNLDAGNNTFEFGFSAGGADLTQCEIALSSCYLYYSWYNISAAQQNNKFSITMADLDVDDAGVGLTNGPWTFQLDLTIPDGQYEIADLNAFVQQFCIDNNFYLIDNATQEYVYFLQLQVNPTRYKVQVNTFAFPAGGAPVGYTAPAAGFLNGVAAVNSLGNPVTITNGAYPGAGSNITPGLIFPAEFNRIVGFSPAPYTISSQTVADAFPVGAYSILSTVSPQVQPTPVTFLNCNIIDNEYTSPATFLYALPAKTTVGDLIIVEPANYNWCRIKSGIYNTILFSITDDQYRPVTLQDPNVVITLVIRDMEDLHPDTGKSGSNYSAHANTMQRYSRHPNNTEIGKDTQSKAAGSGFGNKGLYGR